MTRSIHFRPKLDGTESGVVTRVTAQDAGWDYLNFEVRRFLRNDTWRAELKDHEAALVQLGGRLAIKSSVGDCEIDGREHVFDGLPHAVYFPRNSSFEVTALADKTEVAYCWFPPTGTTSSLLSLPMISSRNCVVAIAPLARFMP